MGLEEGQAQTPTQAPPPATKKDNKMVIVAILLVVVIVIAIGAVLLMGGDDDTGGEINDDTLEWDPKVGDYYEYTTSLNGQEFTKMKFRVVAVTSTTMTMNITATVFGMTNSYEETYPIGQTDDVVSQIENPEPGTTVVDKGMSTVNLDIGSFKAHHYQITSEEDGQSVTMDVYLYKGMLIKMSSEGGGMEASMELTDTNIF